MDGSHFDAWTRRRLAMAAGGLTAALLSGALGLTDAAARKKRRKKRKKNKSTPLQLAFQCPGPPTFIGFCGDECRVAQVFRTTRGGRLARIQIHIDKPNDSAGDYVVQLVRVDNTDTPLHAPLDILAATSIPDADVPVGESLLTAIFAGPQLEAETDYAAAVGRVGTQVSIGTVAGTTCGGQIFSAHGLEPFAGSTSDLVVTIFVD